MTDVSGDQIAHEPKTITVLGSTGSIGTQTLDIVARNPQLFRVRRIAAHGSHIDQLVAQAAQFKVRQIAIADDTQVANLRDALTSHGLNDVEVIAGPDAASHIAGSGDDIVLNAITGSIGLSPTLAALNAGSYLALANKESLVAGAQLVRKATQFDGQILPVDSEHSAMAQALRAGRKQEVRRLILTASGGPFRGKKRTELANVTLDEALAHPTWDMGPVVTINSATLMNKALELIEAHVLFDVAPQDITVVIHPQSIVHSAVEFHDGSTIAQISPPDMRLPIAYALGVTERVSGAINPYTWDQARSWTFEPVDDEAFPALELARRTLQSSPWHPLIFNAANEEAVELFRGGRIGFVAIVDLVTRVLDAADEVFSGWPQFISSINEVTQAERWARKTAHQFAVR